MFTTTCITILMLYLVGVVNVLDFVPFLIAILGFMLLGLVDDLYKLTHLTKSVAQIILVSLYLLMTHIDVTELYLFTGIDMLNGWFSYFVTGFLILLFISMLISGCVWRPPAVFFHQHGPFWLVLAASGSFI